MVIALYICSPGEPKMATSEQKAEKQLRGITECPVCMSAFTDPRMLPCIHTVCFKCLKRTSDAAQKKPGDKMSCPLSLCRNEFTIPEDGIYGVQKNVFMENLLKCNLDMEMGNTISCDMCTIMNEDTPLQIPRATMRCLECQDCYCNRCVKVHQFQTVRRFHETVKLENNTKTG